MSEKDGGPAFPGIVVRRDQQGGIGNVYNEGGMSLRDYFAAAALQGMSVYWIEKGGEVQDFADSAYQMADAMLAARSERGG